MSIERIKMSKKSLIEFLDSYELTLEIKEVISEFSDGIDYRCTIKDWNAVNRDGTSKHTMLRATESDELKAVNSLILKMRGATIFKCENAVVVSGMLSIEVPFIHKISELDLFSYTQGVST